MMTDLPTIQHLETSCLMADDNVAPETTDKTLSFAIVILSLGEHLSCCDYGTRTVFTPLFLERKSGVNFY